MSDGLKKMLTFTKGERIAIIIILSILLIILITNYIIIKTPTNNEESLHNLDSIIALHQDAVDEMKEKEMAEVTRRKEYQAQRKKQKSDYQERAKKRKETEAVRDSLMKKDMERWKEAAKPVEIQIVELNSADSMALLEIPNIGPSFAHRIIEYKSRLGGFCDKTQLLEVYGMDSIRYQDIKDYIAIDTSNIKKVKINYDEFKILVRHPYLEYIDVKKIVNYREHKGLIKDWNDLCKIINRDPNPMLIHYLSYN